jgi:hypothetical protein
MGFVRRNGDSKVLVEAQPPQGVQPVVLQKCVALHKKA